MYVTRKNQELIHEFNLEIGGFNYLANLLSFQTYDAGTVLTFQKHCSRFSSNPKNGDHSLLFFFLKISVVEVLGVSKAFALLKRVWKLGSRAASWFELFDVSKASWIIWQATAMDAWKEMMTVSTT